MTQRELKKGSAELLILSLIEQRARHGYEISKLIAARSEGTLTFQVASLYPLLYRLEGRGWIQGRWVEKAGERRRRFYRLTPAGRKVLAAQRQVGCSLQRRYDVLRGLSMPDWKAIVRERLAGLGLRGAREAEIIEELAQDLEERYSELRTQGLPEAEARRRAEEVQRL